jgi:hypothetical protein
MRGYSPAVVFCGDCPETTGDVKYFKRVIRTKRTEPSRKSGKTERTKKQIQDSRQYVPPAPETEMQCTGTTVKKQGICRNIKELVV